MADFEITVDNTNEVLRTLAEKIDAAMEAVGNQAVSHAKQNLTAASRVDTGALRNSISHVSYGEETEGECYVGTNQEYAIYHEVGTGVYAEGGGGRKTPWAYQDAKGHWHRTRGVTPVHYIKNAMANHQDEYKEIIEKVLKS